ncbi:hypothetical protein IT398_00185 [Candidatus Nomurabacteria bacterium]|nr:hypothetical protein [Candidatus Nomurabacteria bacterium]
MFEVNWANIWSTTTPFLWWFGIPLITVFLILLVNLMARNDFIIGFVPEGQIKAVLAGDSLHKLLVNIGGYDYDRELREITPSSKKKPWRPFGIYWIGLPPFKSVLRYPFSWVKWDKPEDSAHFALIPRNREIVSSLFFRYPYGVQVRGIRLKGNIEVEITLVVTLEIVRPETTLFRIQPTGNWLGLVIAKVEEATRGWAGEKGNEGEEFDVEKLRSLAAREEGAADDLRTRIMEMNGHPPTEGLPESADGTRRLCGVDIISVDFQGWKFVDPDAEKAYQSEEIENRVADGVRAKADGEAARIGKVGDAEARVIAAKLNAAGGNHTLAASLAQATALQETNVRVLSLAGGTPPINTIPVDGPTADDTRED